MNTPNRSFSSALKNKGLIDRSIRSGAMPTSGAPLSLADPVTNGVDRAGNSEDIDQLFSGLPGSDTAATDASHFAGLDDFPGSSGADVADTPAYVAPVDHAADDDSAEIPTAPIRPSPFARFAANAKSTQHSNRAEPFAAASDASSDAVAEESIGQPSIAAEQRDGSDANESLNLSSVLGQGAPSPFSRFSQDKKADPVPKDYTKSKSTSPFSRLAESSMQTVQGRNVAIDVAAAKVLTPLVAAVALQPEAPSKLSVKAAALKEMIVSVKKATDEVILATAPYQSPSASVRSQLMQSVAQIMANRWAKSGVDEMALFAETYREFLSLVDDELAEAINGMAQSRYVEVTSVDVAKERLFVTVSESNWRMLDHVQNDALKLVTEDESRLWYFTFDRPAADVAALLMDSVIASVRASQPVISSEDMRIAHLQSAIKRMTDLVGAEYVFVTRKLMNWMSEPGLSEAEFIQRKDTVVGQFEDEIVPKVIDVAKSNYAAIDQNARRMLEEPLPLASVNKDSAAGREIEK